MNNQHCIIVGGGHAAAKVVASLREQGWSGAITLISAEPHLPYHRPPLSKDYLLGHKPIADLLIEPAAFYREHNIECLLGERVRGVDAAAHTVSLESGRVLSYTKLVLATGAKVRRLPVPGASLPGVHYLRTAEDADAIRRHAVAGRQAVVVGGGYIGLETAAVLRKLGMAVTVLEAFNRILRRVATEEISTFFERVHREQGVDIVNNVIVERLEGAERVQQLVCNDGRRFPADLVVIGIGILPRTSLAEGAGLRVDNGILVDEYCQTSDPDIVAAGDCTEHHSLVYDRPIRLESVQNALAQAVTAAGTLLGRPRPYRELPWFWSTQYDVKLQIAGLNSGFDQLVVRGDIDRGRQVSIFYLRQGRIISVYAINNPPDFALGKRLIEQGVTVDTAMLADPAVPMRALLPR